MLNKHLIGIDIGTSAVKVVEFGGMTSKKLRAIGLELLPPEIVVDGMIRNQNEVVGITSDLLRRLKIITTGRRAAISLSGSSVVIKRVSIPRTNEADFSQQVYYEAEQHFQHDISELYFDYYEARNSLDSQGRVPVVMVGAKREMVEQHISVIRDLGMRVGVVDCDVFAISNMFEFNYGLPQTLVALVNVGATMTQVSLVAGGQYLFTRDVPIGGEEYSRQIMEALGVDKENAEALKVSASMGDERVPEGLQKVMSDMNEQLVNEIRSSIDFFFQGGDAPSNISGLSHLFLAGGGARSLGLDAALSAAMQLPVQIVNPFLRIEVSPKHFEMDYVLMQGHLYGVAVGLSLRAIDDGRQN